MERPIDPREPLGELPFEEPESTEPGDSFPGQEPSNMSNYWQNPDGSIRKKILEKADQIRKGQY